MWLTGRADGPPLVGPPLLCRRLDALRPALGPAAAELDLRALLAERAAIAGLCRNGTTSVGGQCRLLRAADGWIAVSLVRPDDVASIPAWLGVQPGPDPWIEVSGAIQARAAVEVVEAGAVLGLAVSGLGEVNPVPALPTAGSAVDFDDPRPVEPGLSGGDDGRLVVPSQEPLSAYSGWSVAELLLDQAVVARRVQRQASSDRLATIADGELAMGRQRPLVVDLSALWAGPLCAQLLGLGGARVIKVESIHRPDGARRGPRKFYDLLHAGHEAVAFDLREPAGRMDLAALIRHADVVIEASRPRALSQLGIDAEAMLAAETGPSVWLSITGYGRDDGGHRIGFGDDAAVAGGLVACEDGEPRFCADAIADPLTGLVAAAATRLALHLRGRWMLDVALARVAAAFANSPPDIHSAVNGSDRRTSAPIGHVGVERRPGRHSTPTFGRVDTGAVIPGIARPRARLAVGAAAAGIGADTEAVSHEFGLT